jgi:hypothetical protein
MAYVLLDYASHIFSCICYIMFNNLIFCIFIVLIHSIDTKENLNYDGSLVERLRHLSVPDNMTLRNKD